MMWLVFEHRSGKVSRGASWKKRNAGADSVLERLESRPILEGLKFSIPGGSRYIYKERKLSRCLGALTAYDWFQRPLSLHLLVQTSIPLPGFPSKTIQNPQRPWSFRSYRWPEPHFSQLIPCVPKSDSSKWLEELTDDLPIGGGKALQLPSQVLSPQNATELR